MGFKPEIILRLTEMNYFGPLQMSRDFIKTTERLGFTGKCSYEGQCRLGQFEEPKSLLEQGFVN